MCLAAERLYVMDGIYDRFTGTIAEAVSALRQGPPLGGDGSDVDVGAMTMPHQVEIVDRLVQDALQKGARALCGGSRELGPKQGQFYPPTVLVDVTHDMAIMREETFGPVMCIMRVRDEEEALRLANDTVFGLGSTVFTKDAQRAARIARRIRAGSTCINDYGLVYMANELPFGGVGNSGFGRLQGREGLRACTNIKAVMSDRFPMHMASRIYPVRPGDYEMVKAAVNLIYRPLKLSGLRARAEAIKNLIQHGASRLLQ
jgi:acyl-CoA reductase-like NAD-dependent aldehyde dehydrogenase